MQKTGSKSKKRRVSTRKSSNKKKIQKTSKTKILWLQNGTFYTNYTKFTNHHKKTCFSPLSAFFHQNYPKTVQKSIQNTILH
jgi:hypothetical protein